MPTGQGKIISLPATVMPQTPRDGGHSTRPSSPKSGAAPLLLRANDSDLRTAGTDTPTHAVTISHRGKAKVDRRFSNATPESRTTLKPTYNLPYDVLEMVLVHLTHNLEDLKACSLVCRSWYIATVSHLHRTLTLGGDGVDHTRCKLGPVYALHKLGLARLVKEVQVEQLWGLGCWFTPNVPGLHYFSSFSNIHTLKFQNLEIYRFIPNVDYYFGYFSTSLRSITLLNPNCTPRQLSHFLSLFSNLDDIEIERAGTSTPNIPTPGLELGPLSTPKLRGRLALHEFHSVETWTQLITFCGGLQFRHMDLRESAGCVPTLLEACAETLETLRLNARDASVGERSCCVHLRI